MKNPLLLTSFVLGCFTTSLGGDKRSMLDIDKGDTARSYNLGDEKDCVADPITLVGANVFFDILKASSNSRLSTFGKKYSNRHDNTSDIDINGYSIDYHLYVSGNTRSGPDRPFVQTLPVVLNYFKASIIGGYLVVNWGTTSESNNDHFEIEASLDAKDFKTIARTESMGKNGESLQALDYEQKIGLRQIVLSGLSLICLSVIGLGRRSKKTLGLISFGIFLFFIGACRKEPQVMGIVPGQTVYVRLLQIDKDGTKAYSRITSVKYYG